MKKSAFATYFQEGRGLLHSHCWRLGDISCVDLAVQETADFVVSVTDHENRIGVQYSITRLSIKAIYFPTGDASSEKIVRLPMGEAIIDIQ